MKFFSSSTIPYFQFFVFDFNDSHINTIGMHWNRTYITTQRIYDRCLSYARITNHTTLNLGFEICKTHYLTNIFYFELYLMRRIAWQQSILWIITFYFICCIFAWMLPDIITNLCFQPPKKTAYIDRSFYIHSQSGNKIAAIYYKQSNAKYTILLSHGNAEDLSTISEYYKDFGERLNINIILYDYSGYGLSHGTPSETAFYHDIESVYSYLINKLETKSKHIILYGVSIGTGPTTYLASKFNQQIAGVILQSGFTSISTIYIPESIIKILKQISFSTNTIDMFRNVDYIENITDSPVLIIHGTHDYLIPFSNGKYLYNRLKQISTKQVSCFWVKYCGHNDMEWNKGKELRDKIAQFIDYDVDDKPFFVKLDADVTK
eukprot:261168_1